jgi:hypothetical protein
MVTEREEEIWEKEEEVTDTLELGCSELSSHKANLNTRETTLEADRTSLGDLCIEVLACELSAELEASQLAFRDKELTEKEKRLAETQPQELAIACKRLEELQPARAIMLLLLDITGAKMPKLEEAIGELLESEGHALAEMVVEHVLTCFWG